MAEHADGVVVASAIMRRLLDGATVDDVHRFVASAAFCARPLTSRTEPGDRPGGPTEAGQQCH